MAYVISVAGINGNTERIIVTEMLAVGQHDEYDKHKLDS